MKILDKWGEDILLVNTEGTLNVHGNPPHDKQYLQRNCVCDSQGRTHCPLLCDKLGAFSRNEPQRQSPRREPPTQRRLLQGEGASTPPAWRGRTPPWLQQPVHAFVGLESHGRELWRTEQGSYYQKTRNRTPGWRRQPQKNKNKITTTTTHAHIVPFSDSGGTQDTRAGLPHRITVKWSHRATCCCSVPLRTQGGESPTTTRARGCRHPHSVSPTHFTTKWDPLFSILLIFPACVTFSISSHV